MSERRQTGHYKAPRRDDPLTPMGMRIVAAELRLGCTLLVELGAEKLQDHIKDRITLAGKKNKHRQPQTERQEVGNRAMALRIETFHNLANWMAQPAFEEEGARPNKSHEASSGEVGIMAQ